MDHLHLSDVQTTNLYQLQTISHGLLQDRIGTSSRFHLSAEQADLLLTLNTDQLWALMANAGQHTLFPPRPDLADLIKLPLPLMGPLAAVHSPSTGTR